MASRRELPSWGRDAATQATCAGTVHSVLSVHCHRLRGPRRRRGRRHERVLTGTPPVRKERYSPAPDVGCLAEAVLLAFKHDQGGGDAAVLERSVHLLCLVRGHHTVLQTLQVGQPWGRHASWQPGSVLAWRHGPAAAAAWGRAAPLFRPCRGGVGLGRGRGLGQPDSAPEDAEPPQDCAAQGAQCDAARRDAVRRSTAWHSGPAWKNATGLVNPSNALSGLRSSYTALACAARRSKPGKEENVCRWGCVGGWVGGCGGWGAPLAAHVWWEKRQPGCCDIAAGPACA